MKNTDESQRVGKIVRAKAKQCDQNTPRQRSKAETFAPPTAEVGPNGSRIGYMPNGDKVEWIKDEDENGKPTEYAMLLRRNDNDIREAFNELRDKVWYNQHQRRLHRIETGEEPLTKEEKATLARGNEAARQIEQKYGKNNLGWDGFELGLLSGRMSALAWVLGAEWDESLDT